MKPTLSILTPTIPERMTQAMALQEKVAQQANGAPVEHLVFCDNRARSIGAKRQALADLARGKYFAFVDDDDDIEDGYVPMILQAAESGADVITFRQRAIYNGMESTVIFSLENQDEPFQPGGITKRAPWHVCAWKRELVKGCLFGENKYIEDIIWCRQARLRAKTECHIPATIQIYRHDAKTTASPEPD